MMEAVQLLGRGCMYCEVMQEGGVRGVELAEPPGYRQYLLAGSGCGYDEFLRWREGLVLPEYLHCWFCGLPQWACEVSAGGVGCLWPDVVLPVVFVLQQTGHFGDYLAEGLGYQGQSEQDFREWVAGVAEGSGREETNLTKVFRGFAGLYVEQGSSREGKDST
jgi:hypothetical protein